MTSSARLSSRSPTRHMPPRTATCVTSAGREAGRTVPYGCAERRLPRLACLAGQDRRRGLL